MGFTRLLTELAAATANLSPAHRARYDELVSDAPVPPRVRAKSPADHCDTPSTDATARRVGDSTGLSERNAAGQSALTTVNDPSSSTSTSSPLPRSISTS